MCWDKFKSSLLSHKFSCSIHKGKRSDSMGVSSRLKNHVENIIHEIKKADYIRLGSNRMSFVPAHFAVKFLDHNKAKLVELINIDNSIDTLRCDLLLVIQFVFFDNKNLEELIIPTIVNGISDLDVEIDINRKNHQMIVRRTMLK